MLTLPIHAAGITWYRQEDYPRILRIMIDSHVLPRTYADWKKKAEAQECEWQSKGMLVYRAIIDADEFPAWCKSRGLNVDAKGRTAYGSEFAMHKVKETHAG